MPTGRPRGTPTSGRPARSPRRRWSLPGPLGGGSAARAVSEPSVEAALDAVRVGARSRRWFRWRTPSRVRWRDDRRAGLRGPAGDRREAQVPVSFALMAGRERRSLTSGPSVATRTRRRSAAPGWREHLPMPRWCCRPRTPTRPGWGRRVAGTRRSPPVRRAGVRPGGPRRRRGRHPDAETRFVLVRPPHAPAAGDRRGQDHAGRCSWARTTLARCWRSSLSSRCAGST